MLKRQPDISPQERRARRIRAAFLICFSLFLVAILFLVAYFGFHAAQRNPPVTLQPAQSPDGVLLLDVRRLLDEVFATPEAIEAELEVALIRESLARLGRVFFFEENGEERWLAFLPILRPQKLYLENLERALEASEALAPKETAADESTGALAWYEIRPRGIVLSSEKDFPDYEIVETVEDVSPHDH